MNSLLIWRALSGLAFFLLGMNYLETNLKQLAGRKFKLFVRKQANNKLGAIGSAAIVTGIMQSSSVVNLMILAFVGTGITGMNQALALMLGANLGTTLDTWFVALVGFKVNMETYALPVIALTGTVGMLLKKNSRYYNWINFLLGLGLIFFGLDLMKTGIGEWVLQANISSLGNYPTAFLLLIGLIITGMIQSSSATIAITLSALHANALTLPEGMAIVLGSEIGTTLKLILASTNGSVVKKRVALGNFLYNLASSIIILAFLTPIHTLIVNVINIQDPLIGLSFFQTFVNIISIIIFLPLLNVFGRLLERLYRDEKNNLKYIASIPPEEVAYALEALQKETIRFYRHAIAFSCNALNIDDHIRFEDLSKEFLALPLSEQYDYIKRTHGDLLLYSIEIQNQSLRQEDTRLLNRLMASIRSAIYAAKNFKDILPDVESLKESGNETKYQFYLQSKAKAHILYCELSKIPRDKKQLEKHLVKINSLIQNEYTSSLKTLYSVDHYKKLSEIELSTIINFNREMYTSFKSILFSVKDALLEESDIHGNPELYKNAL